MTVFAKDEIARLITNNAKKVGYTSACYEDGRGDGSRPTKPQHEKTNWERVFSRYRNRGIVVLIALLVVGLFATCTSTRDGPTCHFCDQSVPELHEDKSYVVEIPDRSSSSSTSMTTATVTPMTVSYEYELGDGENLFTYAPKELIPNLGFDYAILGVTGFRNLHQLDGSPVSLDEVYVHHFSLLPLNMMGAEGLARNDGEDYVRFPPGYALHILADEYKHLKTNAHMISNKNLEPIEGSAERAHKECNECYYAPGKGSDCTPDVSGTFLCCGDSPACTIGGEFCACATTTTDAPSEPTTTKYRIELELLIAREIDKFTRIDQWNIAAPSCSINMKGNPVFEEYPPDSFCHKNSIIGPKTDTKSNSYINSDTLSLEVMAIGGGSLFHQIPERPDEDPTVRTATSVMAPAGGTLLFAQSHLHTGGVNATLYRNGKALCTNNAVYGTDPDPSTNARNEQGHLVEIGSCYEAIGPEGIRFEPGDIFTTESYYYGAKNDPNLGPNAGGEHKNVMSMFFLGVILDGNAELLTERRTSFNLWNDFVPIVGVRPYGKSDASIKRSATKSKQQHLRLSSSF